MKRRIILTENQFTELTGIHEPGPQNPGMKKTNKPYTIDPEKVKIVKSFLDKRFQRGSLENIGNDGLPETVKIVAMVGDSGDVMRNLYMDQLHDLLVDRFQNMFSDHVERDLFMKRVMDDWYDNKIGIHGTLSVNRLV